MSFRRVSVLVNIKGKLYAYSKTGMRFFGGKKMRIAVIGIVIEKDRSAAGKVNELLSEYGDYIIGRMGVPDLKDEVFVISVIIKATNEIISALTGKLGKIASVNVKSAITSKEL